MRKSSTQQLNLPRLSLNNEAAKQLNVRNERKFIFPKLKRIQYPPIVDMNRKIKYKVMLQSCIVQRNYDQLQDEIKQNQVVSYLKDEQQDNQNDEKFNNLVVGKEAVINYYNNYKKLSKIISKNELQNLPKNLPTSILQKTQKLGVLPSCMGIVKTKGSPTVLNVNNFKFGDKYIEALGAGLKQAKMIQKCLLSKNRLTSLGLKELMPNISHQVSTLDLSHNRITKIDRKLVSLIMENDSRLQHLNLQNNLLGDKNVRSLCEAVTYSKHLKSLNLRKNLLTQESAQILQELISKSNQLEQLYLGVNRLPGDGILQALADNQMIKVFDFSLNRLGQGKTSCVSSVANCLRKNKTLLHFDLSGNGFSKDDSKIIAEALQPNKKIYGFHFRGNYGYIDSKGFLILKQKQDTTLHSILDLEINSYQVQFRREQRCFEPEAYKNVCWICEGWRQEEFKFVVPAEDASLEKKLVYIHFDFELFQPRLINIAETIVKYKTMVPPKKYRYFFTYNKKQYLDAASTNIDYFEIPLKYQYELYCQKTQIQVSKVNYRVGKASKIVNNWNELIIKVLPRTSDLLAKREKIPWTYKNSVWAREWKLDDDDTLKKCFEQDWKNSKISNLVKNQSDQQKVKDILYKNYKIIKEIYRYFSSWSPFSDVWAVSSSVFTEFCQQAKLITKQTPLKIIDLTFITTNSMSGVDWKGSSLVPQRGLVRFQFMQSLVRLSEQKYKKNGIYDNFFESISSLLKDHIISISHMFTIQKWRREKYFVEENDILLKKYRSIFSQVYKKNSKLKVKPGQKSFMCLTQFKGIIQKIGLTTILQRDIYLSFNCSMMTQVDEVKNQRFLKMTEIQFIEGMARVAYLLPENCKLDPTLEGVPFCYKFQWLIHQMKNTLCSQDLKNQFPIPQVSIFIENQDQF